MHACASLFVCVCMGVRGGGGVALANRRMSRFFHVDLVSDVFDVAPHCTGTVV